MYHEHASIMQDQLKICTYTCAKMQWSFREQCNPIWCYLLSWCFLLLGVYYFLVGLRTACPTALLKVLVLRCGCHENARTVNVWTLGLSVSELSVPCPWQACSKQHICVTPTRLWPLLSPWCFQEQRLRYLKQQEQRHQQQASEQEKLQRLRENIENQESRLKKVRALKGQVEQKRLSNGKLGELPW